MRIPLKAVRVTIGVTQQELADKLGVSRESVNAWETGKTEVKPVVLFALAYLSGIKSDDIILPSESSKSVPKEDEGTI